MMNNTDSVLVLNKCVGIRRMERILNQSIREQQDEAYMESLRADQEKQRQRELEKEEIRKIELEKQKLIQDELMKKIVSIKKETGIICHHDLNFISRIQELENQKAQSVEKVPEEPSSEHPDCVCISFKMPNGDRLERRFLSTHTLRVS